MTDDCTYSVLWISSGKEDPLDLYDIIHQARDTGPGPLSPRWTLLSYADLRPYYSARSTRITGVRALPHEVSKIAHGQTTLLLIPVGAHLAAGAIIISGAAAAHTIVTGLVWTSCWSLLSAALSLRKDEDN